MPPAAPIIAAAAISAAGAAIAGTTILGLSVLASAAVIGLGNLALGLAVNALTPKPKRGDFVTGLNGDRTVQVRQPTPPRELVYGEIKKSGALLLAENSDNNNKVHYVLALAGHEVEAIGTVYINDTPVFADQINGAGAVIDGKFAGNLWIKKNLGADSQTADADLIANVAGLTSNFRLRGVAYLYVWHTSNRDLFPNGANISARVRGKKLYDPRSGLTSWSCNPALMWRDYMTNNRYGFGEASARMEDSYITAAANICDEFVQTLAVAQAVALVNDAADALEIAAATMPFFTGDRVQVTTTGSLPGGISAATNYYVIVTKEEAVGSVRATLRLATSYANALAGTGLTITGVGTGTHTVTKNAEPRYTASGLVRLTQDALPKDVIDDLLASMAGYLSKTGGQWLVYAGAWVSSSVAYGMDDLTGGVKYAPRHPRRERYNAVRGKFISPINFDQPDNYPAVTSSLFQAADNGERRYLQLDLPFTYRPQTAQRIAKIFLARHRRMGTLILPLNITGLLCRPGDVITYTDSLFGFVNKTFEVQDHEFASSGEAENPTLGVTLTLREIDAGVYDFDYTTEEVTVAPPPTSNLPNPFLPPTAPAGLTLDSGTAQLFVAGEGTVVSRILATITPSPDGYVSQYLLEWRLSAGGAWQSMTVRADNLANYLAPVDDGAYYDVRAWSINQRGIISTSYVTVSNHRVIGKTEPPPVPDIFAVERLADGTRRFSFGLNTPPNDVRVGGGFKIRYFAGVTASWSAMTDLHTGLLSVSPFETNSLPAGNYTLAVKAVDSTGNESATALFITTTLGDPRIKNAIFQQSEHFLWPGTRTGCFPDSDGALHALSSGNWSSLPATWSALPASWDSILPPVTPIRYETLVIDLGSNLTFTPLVSVNGTGTQTIEFKTGTTADGGVVGSYAAVSGQIVGKRYVQIRVSMADATAPVINSMSTIFDAEAVLEEYPDVNTATASASWFLRIAAGHIRIGSKAGDISAITMARITALQGVGAGWTWVLINKTSTVGGFVAAEFKIYNAAGTLSDATIDVELRGPGTG